MITWIRGIGSLLGLFALVAAAPGYAVAGPPVPNDAVVQACHAGTGPCAILYETTENMSLKALQGVFGDAGIKRIASGLRGLEKREDELRLVVEHFLKMRHAPLGIHRVTMKAAADVIADAAECHRAGPHIMCPRLRR